MDKFGLNLLEQLVLIDSGSDNHDGVLAVQRLMKFELEKIGMQARLVPNPQDIELSSELLWAERKAPNQGKYITLVCHADTVYELNSGFHGLKIDSDSVWANGPGVIDDKGGMVVALWGLKMFFERSQDKHKYSYRLISSPNEEVGSIGFHDLFREIGKESEVILGFEPAFEDGAFVNRRQGNKWYEIKVQGREAHSGRDHAYGVNAAHELAVKLAEISALTDYEKGVTLSVAQIKAGTNKYNIVSGQAKARLDMRFQDPKVGEETHQKVLEILNKTVVKSSTDGLTATTRFRLVDDCPPFNPLQDGALYVEHLRSLIRKHENIDTPPPRRGAAADCCYMARDDILIIDGMGPRGGGMHQSSERVLISSIEARAKVLCEFLEFLESRI